MESRITTELRRIAAEHGGKLFPRDVVDAARNEESPLHTAFEWDDGAAAEKYRLGQARKIISVAVTVLEGHDEPVRAFVSLTPDRTDNGGYFPVEKVLSEKKLRAQMLNDATAELRIFTTKFRTVQELAAVNAEAQKFLESRESDHEKA